MGSVACLNDGVEMKDESSASGGAGRWEFFFSQCDCGFRKFLFPCDRFSCNTSQFEIFFSLGFARGVRGALRRLLLGFDEGNWV